MPFKPAVSTTKLAIQFKLQLGLQDRDHSRLRDYLAHIIIDYRELDKCPVDRDLLKEAMEFVQQRYEFNPTARSLQEIFYRKEDNHV